MQHLTREPLHVDELSNLSGLPINEVSATLTLLELKGMVSQVGSMNYVSAREHKGNYSIK